MAKARRISAALLAALVLAAMMFSLFMIVCGTGHDCIGDNCLVCAVITLCRNTLKTLGDALIAVALLIACFCFTASVLSLSCIATYNLTPISLKVKLLN